MIPLGGSSSRFNVVYRKFRNVSIETMFYLSNSYCLPEYGLALWNITDLSKRHIFKVFRRAFHNAFKRISGASFYHSSHDIAVNCKQLLFEHYLTVVRARYFKRAMKSKNSLMTLCRPYLKAGYHMSIFCNTLRETYGIGFMENDLDIIKARISYVQRNEPQTGLAYFLQE